MYRIHPPIRPYFQGYDLQAVVPGEKHTTAHTTTGHELAFVRYVVRRGDGSEGAWTSHWALDESVSERHDAPARPEQR